MDLVELLTSEIGRLSDDSLQRVIVAIDGPDAAGKTKLALALTAAIPNAVRASIDDFENVREVRYRDGVMSGASYFENGFDFASLRSRLLEPFRDGASRVLTRLREASCDDLVETYVDVPDACVLVVDGVFLQRTELRDLWDLTVYLKVSPDTSLERARVRDLAWTDSVEEVESGYNGRYLPGQAVYRERIDPEGNADFLIDNTDPAEPVVLRQPRL